jgi:hypothetical protein
VFEEGNPRRVQSFFPGCYRAFCNNCGSIVSWTSHSDSRYDLVVELALHSTWARSSWLGEEMLNTVNLVEGMASLWPVPKGITSSSDTRFLESRERYLCQERDSPETARVDQSQRPSRSFGEIRDHRTRRSRWRLRSVETRGDEEIDS